MKTQIQVQWITALQGAHFKISAASGLAAKDSHLYIASDDHAAIFSLSLTPPHVLTSLLGSVPVIPDSKKQKRDYESLLFIEGEHLLTIPSGSSPTRHLGALFSTSSLKNNLHSKTVSFEFLYEGLRQVVSDLNIEGACFHPSGNLILAQRGNSQLGTNGVFIMNSNQFIKEALEGRIELHKESQFLPLSMGKIRDVPLTITDLCWHETLGLLYTAAAEDTQNPYEDGQCLGSAMGVIDLNSRSTRWVLIDPLLKIEGICSSDGYCYLVNDPDQSSMTSGLYRIESKQLAEVFARHEA